MKKLRNKMLPDDTGLLPAIHMKRESYRIINNITGKMSKRKSLYEAFAKLKELDNNADVIKVITYSDDTVEYENVFDEVNKRMNSVK